MVFKKNLVTASIVGVLALLMVFAIRQITVPKKSVNTSTASVKYKINAATDEARSVLPASGVYRIKPERERSLEFSPDPAKHSFKDQTEFEIWAVAHLRAGFDQRTPIKDNYPFLMSARNYLKTHFPENWRPMLDRILQQALYHHANDIKKMYGKIDQYDEWFERSRNLLATMTSTEISACLWQKRKELLGEDAVKIWGNDSRIEQLQDLISIFNDASHISIKYKLQVFESIWNDASANTANPDTVNNYHKAFMNLNSVQMALSQMGRVERAESLAMIREAMGYDDAGIQALANYDQYADQQWENGRSYMAKRDEIVSRYSGVERERQLRLLRRHFFGQKAGIIAMEEASNYFRFRQKRVFGRN